MNNDVLVSNYVFKCMVAAKYPDAFKSLYEALNDYGMVISQDYYNREIKGKWNPMLRGVKGASVNVWNGQFNLWEDGQNTSIRLILTGGSDSMSARIMAKYLFRKLKRYVSVIDVCQVKNTQKQVKNKTNKEKKSVDILDQLLGTFDLIDAVIPDKPRKPKEKPRGPWANYDAETLYPDEDHEGHDHEEDGYCIEADEYIQDMM